MMRRRPRLRRLPAYLLAVVWTFAWGLWRFFAWQRGLWRSAHVWGRRESPQPLVCRGCGWAGPRRWAQHVYGGDEHWCDLCPVCGGEA